MDEQIVPGKKGDPGTDTDPKVDPKVDPTEKDKRAKGLLTSSASVAAKAKDLGVTSDQLETMLREVRDWIQQIRSIKLAKGKKGTPGEKGKPGTPDTPDETLPEHLQLRLDGPEVSPELAAAIHDEENPLRLEYYARLIASTYYVATVPPAPYIDPRLRKPEPRPVAADVPVAAPPEEWS